jgi:hypothetical protein
MGFEACYDEIVAALGRELTPEEKAEIGSDLKELVSSIREKGDVGNLDELIEQGAQKIIQEKQFRAAINKRNAIKNATANLKNYDYVMSVWADELGEGYRAVIGGSLLDRFGSKNSVDAHVKSTVAEATMGLHSRLVSEELDGIVGRKEFEEDLFTALAEHNKEKPDPAVFSKLNPEIVRAAQIMSEAQEIGRKRANLAGAAISKREGYALAQTHDAQKIAKAAGHQYKANSPEHRAAWKEFVRDKLNWDEMAPNRTAESREKYLDEMFTQFATGVHVTFGDTSKSFGSSSQNIGARLSRERKIIFKNPKFEFEYNKKFGSQDGIFGGFLQGLQRVARDTAIMEKLGPDASANLKQLQEKILQKLVKENNTEAIEKFNKSLDFTNKVFDVVTGAANIPGNPEAAALFSKLRGAMRLGDLPAAVISSLTDIINAAATLNYGAGRNYASLFKGMAETVSGIVDSFGGASKKERAAVSAELRFFTDTIANAAERFDATDISQPGILSKMQQIMFKYTGLTGWQDGVRRAAAKGTSVRYALYADTALKDLPQGMSAVLRQYGIDEKGWDTIRSAPQMEIGGDFYLSPNSLDNLTAEQIKAAGGKKKIKELKDNFGNLFTDVSSTAATEPGAIEKAMLSQGQKPGTAPREMLNAATMYKTFTVTLMRKHLGRELKGYSQDNISVVQGLARLFNGKNKQGAMALANSIAFGAIFGYASGSLKEITKGRTPRVPETKEDFAKIMAASLAQSGALGLYGDFLFGQTDRFGRNFSSALLGPMVGRVDDIAKIYGSLYSDEDTAAKIFQFAKSNTPGVNAVFNSFYTRVPMDYAITYRFQEWMNPGYLMRMERKLREKNQEFWLPPPSQVIPYGGK